MLLQGAGDIYFYKKDGSTTSLLWDESDDRWEYATNVRIAGNLTMNASDIDGVNQLKLNANTLNSIEIGRTDGTASTPFMDWHSGATAVDYDVRMIASGGTGSNAGGVLKIETAGIGINVAPAATLHVDQSSASAAIPVLTLDQADVSEEMIEFITTIGVGNAIEAVGAKTLTTTHFIKVTLPGGLTRYIPAGTIA